MKFYVMLTKLFLNNKESIINSFPRLINMKFAKAAQHLDEPSDHGGQDKVKKLTPHRKVPQDKGEITPCLKDPPPSMNVTLSTVASLD